MVEFVRLENTDAGKPLYRQGFGGDTSNVIVAAARQGARTGYLTAVGDDIFGHDLHDLWTAEGVDTSNIVTRKGDPTGVYFVQPHAEGRFFSYARRGSAASFYSPANLPVDAIAAAKILHVSALSQAISQSMRDAVYQAATLARAKGALVSYDTNLRLNLWTLEAAKAEIIRLLPLSDIVFPSDDEAELLLDIKQPDAIVDWFLQFGAKHVILKRGSKGIIVASQKSRVRLPVHKVIAVDSTGAGDSFAGAFLAYFMETENAGIAAQRAAIVTAFTVAGMGAIDPIPYRTEVLATE